MNLLLTKYFFPYIDKGYRQEQTPLFSRVVDGKPLAAVLAKELRELTPSQIIEEIEYAQREVELAD
ncbi:MAG: hypothetical protein IAE94_05305 [Chthoniobacterales bacterium]|nr:hypothetical protein [Chthoniobacterales bacterium]